MPFSYLNKSVEGKYIISYEEGIDDRDVQIQSLASILVDKGTVVVENWDIADKIRDFLDDKYWGDPIRTKDAQTGKITITIPSDWRIKRKKEATETVEEVEEKEDIEEIKKWWKKVFGDNIPLDANIVGLIKTKGEDAWGLFSEAMVRFSIDAPKGTGFHEAFLVVFWLYFLCC